MKDRFFLGLPAWAFPGWKDRYFTDRPSRLSSYARVFNTVEGNTTFYRVPDRASVERWRAAVDGTGFRFCFKLPREVTHEKRPERDSLQRFLTAVEPLHEHLGPLLVQFPATVSPALLARFEPVFDSVRRLCRFVIEVRHPAFFEDPGLLAPVLATYEADRVVFDSTPLFQGDLDHPEVLAARHEKPDVPVIEQTPNGVTLVRLILHPDIRCNGPHIDRWAARTAAKLAAGGTVYMMIHCPNNQHCPPLARQFDAELRRKVGGEKLPPLAEWPVPLQQSLLGDC